MGEKRPVKFIQTHRLTRNFWFLQHAANLRYGTGGFTSPPKEGMQRIFRHESPVSSAGLEHEFLGTRGQHAYCQTTEAAMKGI
jgi:hypothetical protein